jgi:hypothetical protein
MGEQSPDYGLHPSGQSVNTCLEILAYRRARIRGVKNGEQPLCDLRVSSLHKIPNPVKPLHDPHGRPASPVQSARSRLLELQVKVSESD